MLIGFGYLFFAITFTALAQFFFKVYKLNQRKIFLLLTLLMFVSTPIFSMKSLQYLSIDTVYVSTALTIFIVVALSYIFLKEIISKKQIIGIAMIITGVVIYGSF